MQEMEVNVPGIFFSRDLWPSGKGACGVGSMRIKRNPEDIGIECSLLSNVIQQGTWNVGALDPIMHFSIFSVQIEHLGVFARVQKSGSNILTKNIQRIIFKIVTKSKFIEKV